MESIIDGGTDVGLEIFSETTTNIKNTKIINFLSDGIQAFSNPTIRISDSEISGNETGIRSWGADIEIKNSIIKDNALFEIYNLSSFFDYKKDFIERLPIKAVGNWWGDSSGPYNELTNASGTAGSVSGNVLYSPWLTSDPNKKKNPVIIIPGIMSSYLNRNSYDHVEVWLNLAKALIPGDDSYLDELSLDEFGEPDLTHSLVLPTDIFREIGGKVFFDGLINELKNNGYIENEDLFVFPYDWRLDIRDSVDNSYSPLITSLKDKIDKVLLQAGAEKVDIIAHSMGGLLSKYYIEHYGQDKVDKFIDIATPHLGAPSALKALTYG
ncbi:MAG: alpha/beta fold hydrolase, partial [bacterium]